MKHDPRPNAPQRADSAAVHLSLSEIAALAWRATRGAGRTWGEAEESAEAACWLARAGTDWASALIGALALSPDTSGCPLRAGIALADFAALPEGVAARGALLTDLRHPAFVLPFAARAATATGQALRLEWAGATATLAPLAAPMVEGAIMATGPVDVRIAPVSLADPLLTQWPARHHGTIAADHYATLNALMLRFTVPASATSQAGAGAQGNDND